MVDGNPVVSRDQSSALRDPLTVVRGLHSLTFGGEYRRIQSNPVTDTNGRGAFVFSGLLTSGFDDNLKLLPGYRLRFRGFPLRLSEHRQSPVWKLRQLLPLVGATTRTWWTIGRSAPTCRSTWACATNISRRTPRSTTACPTSIWRAASPARPWSRPGQSGPYTGVFPRALIDSRPEELISACGDCLAAHPKAAHRAARRIQHLLQRLHLRRIARDTSRRSRPSRRTTPSSPASTIRCAWPPASHAPPPRPSTTASSSTAITRTATRKPGTSPWNRI